MFSALPGSILQLSWGRISESFLMIVSVKASSSSRLKLFLIDWKIADFLNLFQAAVFNHSVISEYDFHFILLVNHRKKRGGGDA